MKGINSVATGIAIDPPPSLKQCYEKGRRRIPKQQTATGGDGMLCVCSPFRPSAGACGGRHRAVGVRQAVAAAQPGPGVPVGNRCFQERVILSYTHTPHRV